MNCRRCMVCMAEVKESSGSKVMPISFKTSRD
jgi:hypothetical protein